MRRVLLAAAVTAAISLVGHSLCAEKSQAQSSPRMSSGVPQYTAPAPHPTPQPPRMSSGVPQYTMPKSVPPPPIWTNRTRPTPVPPSTSGSTSGSPASASNRHHHHADYYDYQNGYNPYSPYYNRYGYGYPSSYPYPYDYSAYYPYGSSPNSYSSYSPYSYSPYAGAYLGPIFMSPWQLYGPGPIMQMMGVSGWFQNPTPSGGGGSSHGNQVFHQPVKERPAREAADDQGNDKKPAPERATNQRSTDLAMRYIKFGDTHFGNQEYSDALDRYKKASVAGPQLADAWFRQAFAQAALGRYEQAARAVKRGFDINPEWAKSDFQLSEVYGGDEKTKKINIDAIAKAAEAEPGNGDVALLLGIHYYFDGQKDKATPILERAQKAGANEAVVKSFLAQ